MPQGFDDIPLRLLKRRDGTLCLRNHLNQIDPNMEDGDPLGFPTMHEFSQEWLLENTMSGNVAVSEDAIVLNLANGTATYAIRRDLMEETFVISDEGEAFAIGLGKNVGDTHTRKLATGYWGELTGSSVWTPAPVDPAVYEED